MQQLTTTLDASVHHQRATMLGVPNCSGGLILHTDGSIAGCTLDDDIDGCTGLEERHEDAPETCW